MSRESDACRALVEAALGDGFASWAKTKLYWQKIGLNTRLCNALASEGIKNKEELRKISYAELLRIPNLGRKSINILYATVKGLSPQDDPVQIQHKRERLERQRGRLERRISILNDRINALKQ